MYTEEKMMSSSVGKTVLLLFGFMLVLIVVTNLLA